MEQIGHGLDPGDYVDEDVFALERARVFRGSWIPVCRAEDVAAPGDYVSHDLVGDPIVVTRTRDGELRALANVCRHRNMVIASGSGNTKALRCPYHLWTYSLDGRLVGAPATAGLDGFDAADHCLPQLGVEEWHGFVLVNHDPDAASFRSGVAHLDAMAADLRLAEMVRVGAITWDQPWNWKLTLENYAESYHHPGIHPDTLQPFYPGDRSVPVTGGGEPWLRLDHGTTDDETDALVVLAAYPLLLPTVVGADAMTWLKLEPVAADRSRLTTEVFVHAGRVDDADFVQFQIDAVRIVNAQDERANTGVFAGLRSSHAVRPVLLPLEAGVAHFASWYRDRMQRT